MILIHDIAVPPLPEAERRAILEKKLRRFAGGALPAWRIFRRSVDARKKDDIHYVYTLALEGLDEKAENQLLRHAKGFKAERTEPVKYALPESGAGPLMHRPLIVGAGPAGLFAAWVLAKAGFRPLILEQGASVEERDRDVEAFWKGGRLKPWSNVQFGEGGAGTFSDGKLNTGIRDPEGRIGEVLRIFADCGGDPSILYDAKPHIGTDVLKKVVRTMRERITAMGGSFRFHARMTDIICKENVLTAVRVKDTVTGAEEEIPASVLILALGHSARETFLRLHEQGVAMEPKPFAVGVRIEHPQELIDRIQYGSARPENLPPADYKLTAKAADGRGVYSFCMCPGGQVVNASSEEGRLCVNGMSRHARDGRNANAALVVQVGPEDFAEADVFAGLRFQRAYEEAAFRLAQGRIPVQRFADFAAADRKAEGTGETESKVEPADEAPLSVLPDTCGAWARADVASALPAFVRKAILEAMPQFDRRMPGYAFPEALIDGFEARTSSPLRIPRGENGECSVCGLYPAGEGAGYAGGITSAAVDGMKQAEKIIRRFAPPAEG